MKLGLSLMLHIGSMSNRYYERMWFLQWQYYINLTLSFLQTNHDFGRWKQYLLIFYLLHFFVREFIIVSMLSVIHGILQNSNPFT